MKRLILALSVIALSACTTTSREALPLVEQTVVISDACQDGLSEMRNFMTTHEGPLDDEVRAYLRTEADKAYETCSVQEFRTFMKAELTPWAEQLSLEPTTSSAVTTSTTETAP